MVFQAFQLLLLRAGLRALWTDMFVVHFDIAQRTEKPPAMVADQGRFFLRVIETTRFAFRLQSFTGVAERKAAHQRREHKDIERTFAAGAGYGSVGMVEFRGNRRVTFRAA